MKPGSVWTLDMLPGRIVAKLVESDNGCWHWTGARNKFNGYGSVGRTGQSATTPHKLVYETLVGPVPAGMHVGHVCHDLDPTCAGGPGCEHRICANPGHLSVQTPYENNHATQNSTANRTHCAHGHEFSGDNLYLIPSGKRAGRRVCLACKKRTADAYNARRLRDYAAEYATRQQVSA